MDKKKLVSMVAIFLIAFGGGFGTNYLIGNNEFSDVEGYRVRITSLEDNQEVHSVVVVDASTWNADKVEVLVNGELVANYLPYYWNNMLEPVGEYDITVNIYSENETLVSTDTKTVIIPEEFTVTEDYVFDEDFVVHTGQTVYFPNYVSVSANYYSNGETPLDERTYFSINVFGTLYIESGVRCKYFTAEENGSVYLMDGNIKSEMIEFEYDGHLIGANVRFDDDAVLYLSDTIEFSSELIYTPVGDAILINPYQSSEYSIQFMERSYYEVLS